jgi:hypothetical protein
MQRTLTLVLVASIALSSLPAGIAAGAANTTSQEASSVSITNVSVSPDDVAPGERVTIRATLKNLETSQSNVEIDSVRVRERKLGGNFERTRVRNLGSLNPGASTTVPLSLKFDEPGTKRLLVTFNVVNEEEQRIRVTYPVVVDVTEQHPQLDIGANDSVASAEESGQVTIANGLDTSARNVVLSVSGSSGLSIRNPKSVRPALDSGETTTARFRYEADAPGTYQIRAVMRYNVPGGQTRRTTTSVPIEVEPLKRNVVLDATSEREGSTMSIDVFNRGNAPMENVTVTGEAANATVPQRYLGSIPAQSSRSLRLNASLDGSAANVRVRATYEIADRDGTATDTVRLTQTPGEIELTGLTVQPEGGRLAITGSASNVGLTEASSVTVRVRDTATVTPAAPREYFVGRVPASDFVTFEVFARTEGNVSEIPLEVSYLADGERRTRTVLAEVDQPAPSADGPPRQGGSGGLLVPAIGVIVVLGVLGAIVYGWRNRGGA